ncbi:MAG: 6-bladed beta-propeller, partial [Gemmatimonadaceae bacterium]
MRINSNNPAWELSQIVGMVVDKAGRIYVLDATDQNVHVYAPDGKPVQKLGRRGSGPGEFEHASTITMQRDSVWVLDRSSARISAFSIQTGGSRTLVLRAQTKDASQPIGVLASGHLMSVTVTSP